jgi:type I restriction-modification system DNA methylase subunit
MIKSEYAKKVLNPDQEKLHEIRRFADYAWTAAKEGGEKTEQSGERKETSGASVDFALIFAAYQFLSLQAEDPEADDDDVMAQVSEKMSGYQLFKEWLAEPGFFEAVMIIVKKAAESQDKSGVHWDLGDFLTYLLCFNSRAADAIGNRSEVVYRLAWTPQNVSDLVIDLLEINGFDSVADFGCGLASFLREVFIRKLGGAWFGVESNRLFREIALIRKELLDAQEFEILNAETDEGNNAFLLEENRKFDRIFVQAPMWDRLSSAEAHIADYRAYLTEYAKKHEEVREALPEEDDELEWKRYEEWRDDWAFFLLAFEHLNEGGRAVVISDGRGLWDYGAKPFRDLFLKNGWISAVITVDGAVLNYRSKPFSIIVFEKEDRSDRPVKLIDARPLWKENDGPFLTEEKRKYILDLLNYGEEAGAFRDPEINHGEALYRTLTIEQAMNSTDLRPEYYLFSGKFTRTERLGDLYSVTRSHAALNPGDTRPIKQLLFWSGHLTGGEVISGLKVKTIGSEDKTSTYGAEVKDCGLMMTRTFPIQMKLVKALEEARTVLGINSYLIEWNEKDLPVEEKEKELNYLQAFLESRYGQQMLKLMTNERLVNINELKDLRIPFPETEERRRIGEEFRKRRVQITKYQAQIYKLEGEIEQGAEFESLLK